MTANSHYTPSELARIFGDVRTDRLLLRRPRTEDASALFTVHGDPETNRYNPYGADRDQATSEETLRNWLRQWEDEGYGYWAVTFPETVAVIGFGGVRRFAPGERGFTVGKGDVLNLYYRLVPGVGGKGYATELAQIAVRCARKYLPHLPLIARVRAANVPSVRTAVRSGLERRPDLDTADHLIFALGLEL